MFKSSFLSLLLLLTLTLLPSGAAGQARRKTAEPQRGERIDQLLRRNGVDAAQKKLFIAINWAKLTPDDGLMMGYRYELPTKEDMANADKIIDRETKARRERKRQREANDARESRRPKTKKEPLFGKGNETVDITDHRLEGATYYLVSGHGGPDPGAMSTYGGQTICEDEYAYDVILRLARQLMSHGATTHIIIQDPDDGIRDDAALKCDEDETCMGAPIPLDQIKRLRQRSDSINSLYDKERGGYCRSVFIHVDSRSKDTRIDIFFYHYMKSERGQRLALRLQAKMSQKYAKHQPNRGFSGEVKERDLYVLRETNPAGVFIEIGNIQNSQDMVRLAKANNREAMARWLAEGLMEDFLLGAKDAPKPKQ